MTSRCCWLNQPASATRTYWRGCGDSIAASLSESEFIAALGRSVAAWIRFLDTSGRSRQMKYALLIYAAERDFAEKSQEEQGRIYKDYMTYTVELKKSGKMLSCEPLDHTSTATTIRVRNGKTVSNDGPFPTRKSNSAAFMSSTSRT